MNSPIYERAISAFPISVGTSLALESLFKGELEPIDPDRKIPNYVDINEYQEFWINVSTLFRNFFNSIDKDKVKLIRPKDFKEGIFEEMNLIRDIVAEQSLGKTKLRFYYCTYKDLDRELKGANLRTFNTDKQKHYQKMLLETLKEIKLACREKQIELLEFNTIIRPDWYCKVLILTHYSVDLLAKGRFKVLDLLESHTGVLKHHNTWYTKYFNGKDLTMLPFNSFLLKVFGDNELIHPYHFKIRKLIVEVAIDFKWNFNTSMSKIHSDISKIKDHFVRNELIKLM